MLPAPNRKDLESVSEDVRNSLQFVWREQVDDAIAAALEGTAAAREAGVECAAGAEAA